MRLGWVLWLLHDADAAVELTLGIVVVDVGVAAAHVGRGHRGEAGGIAGTAVLKQNVGTLLASSASGVRQRRLATSISAFYVHTVLLQRKGKRIG